MGINKVTVTGNLTRDPELRNTASGLPVLSFGIAVNDREKANGQWLDRPNFIDCTMFGTRAEKLWSLLDKGAKVAISGKLRWSQWERNGQKRSKIEIIVEELDLMYKPRNDNRQDAYEEYGTASDDVDFYDENIPF